MVTTCDVAIAIAAMHDDPWRQILALFGSRGSRAVALAGAARLFVPRDLFFAADANCMRTKGSTCHVNASLVASAVVLQLSPPSLCSALVSPEKSEIVPPLSLEWDPSVVVYRSMAAKAPMMWPPKHHQPLPFLPDKTSV